MTYEVLVEVRLRAGIADPQGATIERALPALGFETIDTVRVGKAIRLHVGAPDEDAARRRAQEVADRLLANPVIEESEIRWVSLVDAEAASPEDRSAPAAHAPPSSAGAR